VEEKGGCLLISTEEIESTFLHNSPHPARRIQKEDTVFFSLDGDSRAPSSYGATPASDDTICLFSAHETLRKDPNCGGTAPTHKRRAACKRVLHVWGS
jgi:hypothetical protein